MSWSSFSVVFSTTSSDSASIIEFSSEVSFLKGKGFSSVWNNKNFSESLKNSRTWELILDIDIFTFDPVANKGDGGINDYLYEKGNQLTILAFSLQNIVNNINSTTETTQDYFKSIAEEVDLEYAATSQKVDIETPNFVLNVLNNITTAKQVTLDEANEDNTVTAL